MQQPDHLNSVLRDSPHVWARDFLPSRSKPHSGNVWHADLGLWAQLQTGKWCGRALLPSNWTASATDKSMPESSSAFMVRLTQNRIGLITPSQLHDFCSHATKFWRGVWQRLAFWSRTLPSQGRASSRKESDQESLVEHCCYPFEQQIRPCESEVAGGVCVVRLTNRLGLRCRPSFICKSMEGIVLHLFMSSIAAKAANPTLWITQVSQDLTSYWRGRTGTDLQP